MSNAKNPAILDSNIGYETNPLYVYILKTLITVIWFQHKQKNNCFLQIYMYKIPSLTVMFFAST